jgi:uncharacterized protein (TIGR02145 family)
MRNILIALLALILSLQACKHDEPMKVCDVINLTLVNNTDTKQTSGIFEQADSGVNNFSAARTTHPRWDDGGLVYGIDLLKFNALPGGIRNISGVYQHIGKATYFWTASPIPINQANYIRLNYYLETVSSGQIKCVNGMSVRCMRTATESESSLADGTVILNAYTDIDGNSYNAVKIGTQVWLNSNLKVTRYTDGSPIATGLSDAEWASSLTGAYAVYPFAGYFDTEHEMIDAYGLLYNWWAIGNISLIVSDGWIIPGYGDYTTLITYLTNNYNDYEKGTILKSYFQDNTPYVVESIEIVNETPESNYDSLVNSVLSKPIVINRITFNSANSLQQYNTIKQVEKTIYGETVERVINLQNYIDPVNPNPVIVIDLDTPIVINDVQFLQMDLEAYSSANMIFEFCQGTDDIVDISPDTGITISLQPVKGDIMYNPKIKQILLKYQQNQQTVKTTSIFSWLVLGMAVYTIYKFLKK